MIILNAMQNVKIWQILILYTNGQVQTVVEIPTVVKMDVDTTNQIYNKLPITAAGLEECQRTESQSELRLQRLWQNQSDRLW